MIAEIKLRAERRAGELLGEMDKNEGGRPAETSNIVLPVSCAPTLSDLGITRMTQSSDDRNNLLIRFDIKCLCHMLF